MIGGRKNLQNSRCKPDCWWCEDRSKFRMYQQNVGIMGTQVVKGETTAYTKKFEWLKVSSCWASSSDNRMSLSTRIIMPKASPVMEADMPSPMYLELQTQRLLLRAAACKRIPVSRYRTGAFCSVKRSRCMCTVTIRILKSPVRQLVSQGDPYDHGEHHHSWKGHRSIIKASPNLYTLSSHKVKCWGLVRRKLNLYR